MIYLFFPSILERDPPLLLSWRVLHFLPCERFLGGGVFPDPMWKVKGQGCRMWTDCKALWGRFVICDIGLYKINWIKLYYHHHHHHHRRRLHSRVVSFAPLLGGFLLPQWVSTLMPSPWRSCLECCAVPWTDSSWTDTREGLSRPVNTHVCMCVHVCVCVCVSFFSGTRFLFIYYANKKGLESKLRVSK